MLCAYTPSHLQLVVCTSVSTVVSQADDYIGQRAPALFALALLTQSSLYSVLLLPPLFLLLRAGPTSSLKTPKTTSFRLKDVVLTVFGFISYMLVLIGIGTLVAGNFRWIKETWGATYVQVL